MKQIRKEDISKLNDIVLELPAFRDLESKENLSQVFNMFLEEIYLKQPQELIDIFDFQLNNKMQETFFINYGIDKSYYEKIRGYLKSDLAFTLERLFQNKGSTILFKMYADLFENIFKRINFYNVRVYKIPNNTGDAFIYEYRLEPLYITDEASVIEKPQVPIGKKRKYLMELENFKDYTAWPMPTNLVYIQFSIGTDLINNLETFLNGVRAYSMTLLQGKFFNYESRSGVVEQIEGCSLEILLMYFRLETISKRNPGWDLNEIPVEGTYLPYFENTDQWRQTQADYLESLEELINDYQEANYADRSVMTNLKRRWQLFLRQQERTEDLFSNLDEFRSLVESKWPHVYKDFNYFLNYEEDPGLVLDFYVKLYSIFTNGIYAFESTDDPNVLPNYRWDWVTAHVDVVFGNLFLASDFLDNYFDPVMNLFIRYFFPVEMEYINDLIYRVKIRDKWNTWAIEENIKSMVIARHTSLQTPIRGIDWHKISLEFRDWHSHIDHTDKSRTVAFIPVSDGPLRLEDEVTKRNLSCRH